MLTVQYAGMVEDEMARGTRVGKGVLCCARWQCRWKLDGVVVVGCVEGAMAGLAANVVIVVVGEEGKTILGSKTSGRGGGRLASNRTIISTLINSY